MVQVMACRVVGTKQVSEPMMVYCQLASLETNVSEILIEIQTFSFKKLHFKMSGKWWSFCYGLSVLTNILL